jgi:S-adenosyl methyltransferase
VSVVPATRFRQGLRPSGIVPCELTAADDGTAAGSQRFVVSDKRTMPQIVMSLSCPATITRRRYEQRSRFTMSGPGARWRTSVTGSTTSSFGDTTVPSTARMYDYWLGGHDNFAADRAAALKVRRPQPQRPAHGRARLPVPLRPLARPPGHPRTGQRAKSRQAFPGGRRRRSARSESTARKRQIAAKILATAAITNGADKPSMRWSPPSARKLLTPQVHDHRWRRSAA